MKCQVPCCVPRVFPLVGHGDHVGVVEVVPVAIPSMPSLRWWRRLSRVAVEPLRHVVIIELFAPNHAGKRLALHQASVGIGLFSLDVVVEFVCLTNAPAYDLVKCGEWHGKWLIGPAQTHTHGTA